MSRFAQHLPLKGKTRNDRRGGVLYPSRRSRGISRRHPQCAQRNSRRAAPIHAGLPAIHDGLPSIHSFFASPIGGGGPLAVEGASVGTACGGRGTQRENCQSIAPSVATRHLPRRGGKVTKVFLARNSRRLAVNSFVPPVPFTLRPAQHITRAAHVSPFLLALAPHHLTACGQHH